MPYGGRQFALIGQAGVYAVTSQLILRGVIPLFPAVDNGYDIALENGIRLQVKSANLIQGDTGWKRKYGQNGVYWFDLRRYGQWDRHKKIQPWTPRSYRSVADFFILWGITENRFWVVSTAIKKQTITFPGRNSCLNDVHFKKYREEKLALMEERWDLLSIDSVNALIDGVSLPPSQQISATRRRPETKEIP